ncbi:MAG: hypothetical protein AB7O97_01130 [Planctomycetota bacterium]
MAKKKNASPPQRIAIEHKGTTYEGSYWHDGEMVDVECDIGGRDTTQIGASREPAALEVLAKIILRELVEKALLRQRAHPH